MLFNKPLDRLKILNTYDCLWPYILRLLEEKPMHAYILREKVKKRFKFLPGAVTSYTTLYSLYVEGLVSKEVQGRVTIYKITKKGRLELKKARDFYKETLRNLD